MFMVLSSWHSHCESSPECPKFDECRMAPSGRRPKTKPNDLRPVYSDTTELNSTHLNSTELNSGLKARRRNSTQLNSTRRRVELCRYKHPFRLWVRRTGCQKLHHHRHLLLLLSLKADTHFTVPQRVEGWVDLAGWLHTGMVYQSTDGHPSWY